jgi:hypothetical protein
MFNDVFFGYITNIITLPSGVGVMLKRHFITCVNCDCPLDYEMCLGLHVCDACKVDPEYGLEDIAGFETSFDQMASSARFKSRFNQGTRRAR